MICFKKCFKCRVQVQEYQPLFWPTWDICTVLKKWANVDRWKAKFELANKIKDWIFVIQNSFLKWRTWGQNINIWIQWHGMDKKSHMVFCARMIFPCWLENLLEANWSMWDPCPFFLKFIDNLYTLEYRIGWFKITFLPLFIGTWEYPLPSPFLPR